MISLAVAICSAYFWGNEKYKKKGLTAAFVMGLGLISGLLGTAIQWILFRDTQFENVSSMSEKLTDIMGIPYWGSVSLVNSGLNIIDKLISVIAAMLIITIVPQHIKRSIWISGWKQKPLSNSELQMLKKRGEEK
jgi:hypothetical protein